MTIIQRALLIAAACLAPPGLAVGQVQRATIPGSEPVFELDARTGKVDNHLGRRALFVRGQAPPVFVTGLEFVDGTIEFDLAALPAGNFLGLVFRYEDPFFHENVYFRLQRSGSFEAVQYAPRVNSTAGSWQLYREFMATAVFPIGEWLRVRAEISGNGLVLFVGDSTRPLLVVPRLRGTTRGGRVGFWGRVSDRPDEWTAAISNVRVVPRPASPAVPVDTVALPEGSLTGWSIAGPFDAPDSMALPPMPGAEAWSPIPLEEGGLLNITRQLRKPRGGRHLAFLRNTVRVPREQRAVLEIEYSDDAIVWLNGAPLWRGFNGLNSRYPGYLGLLSGQADHLYLPLRAGENTLVIAVAERTFGWGLRARVLLQ